MVVDAQRIVDIAIAIASVIVAVMVIEGLVGVLRQGLRLKKGFARIQDRPAPFDAEALERDLARIAAAGVAAGALQARVVAALQGIEASFAEWRATVQRIKLLRARARALPEILSQPIRR
jgi:hypothetical protein